MSVFIYFEKKKKNREACDLTVSWLTKSLEKSRQFRLGYNQTLLSVLFSSEAHKAKAIARLVLQLIFYVAAICVCHGPYRCFARSRETCRVINTRGISRDCIDAGKTRLKACNYLIYRLSTQPDLINHAASNNLQGLIGDANRGTVTRKYPAQISTN